MAMGAVTPWGSSWMSISPQATRFRQFLREPKNKVTLCLPPPVILTSATSCGLTVALE